MFCTKGGLYLITGLMTFQEKKCVFKLNDFTLEIEGIEDRDKVFINDLDFLFDLKEKNGIRLGTLRNAPNLLEDINILKGIDFENGQEFLFHIRNINQTGPKTHTANLHSYIVFENGESFFDGLQINAEELNWFHNIRNAYTYKITPTTGQSEVSIEPFENTEKKFNFNVGQQVINGSFNISRNLSNMATMPIRLQTDMNLYFEPTNEFEKIEELIYVTFDFLKFITYRRNTVVNYIILKKKNEETGNYSKVGKFFINRIINKQIEEKKLIQERLIDLPLIEYNLGNLFEKLLDKKIYLTHIPENSVDKNIITPSRFIMVTAGFEWQFRLIYKELNSETETKYKEQREEILSFLEEKIKQNSGKKKKVFKDFKNLLLRSNMTLSNKINWALNEFSDVLDLFIKSLYKINNVEEIKYNEISERIQTQRNNVAHGNIDQEFDSLIILDFFVLEWLYYAMVLSDIGMSRENIKLSINKLFNRRIAL